MIMSHERKSTPTSNHNTMIDITFIKSVSIRLCKPLSTALVYPAPSLMLEEKKTQFVVEHHVSGAIVNSTNAAVRIGSISFSIKMVTSPIQACVPSPISQDDNHVCGMVKSYSLFLEKEANRLWIDLLLNTALCNLMQCCSEPVTEGVYRLYKCSSPAQVS